MKKDNIKILGERISLDPKFLMDECRYFGRFLNGGGQTEFLKATDNFENLRMNITVISKLFFPHKGQSMAMIFHC